MAVRSSEEIMESLREIIGDRNDDTALSILEDVSDTISDYSTRITESGDWKKKYEENDAAWREKYKLRFYGDDNSGQAIEINVEGDNDNNAGESEGLKTSYDELFKEG